jgi:hypothetical protein
VPTDDMPPNEPRRTDTPDPDAPETERAWWDISGMEIPGSEYQPVPDDAGRPEDADRESIGLVATLQTVAEPVAGAIEGVLNVAGMVFAGETSGRHRRLKRLNATPLPSLYDVHPDARNASPRELGMRFVRIEDVVGTAVSGIAQRGSDFLPLRPFRGANWEGRWQRINGAVERLESLPPVDLVKFAGEYWVLDGHNRVAATLYANGAGVDAVVTELVPLGGQVSERPTALLPLMGDSRALRGVGMEPDPDEEDERR